MSDFEQPSYVLPPPPAPVPPPQRPIAPFGVPGAPPYGTFTAPGYPLIHAAQPSKPPRPAVKVGSLLLIGGGAGLILGSVLPWVTVSGQSLNGFSDDSISLDGGSNGGPAFVFFAVLLIGFGIAQLAARKVLAVAILAVVFASFALVGVLAEFGDVSDVIDFTDLFGLESSWGPGVPVLGLASLVGLGGGIATLAKRRR